MFSVTVGGSKSDENLSEYERQRLQNISEMKEQFSDLFEEVHNSAEELMKASCSSASGSSVGESNGRKRTRNTQSWRRTAKVTKTTEPSEIIMRRSARLINENKKTEYNEESDSDEGSTKRRRGLLLVRFPFSRRAEYDLKNEQYYKSLDDGDFIVSDDEDIDFYRDDEPRSKRQRRSTTTVSRLPVSQVTSEMLKKITYSSSGKEYSINGTTCHQCRQKTADQKSYCRHKNCRGARGMFCGFCLGKRYGEDVAETLLNPRWACPPCRGYCNCSICRRRLGLQPTGQMALQAKAGGYKSVRHYLYNIEGEGPSTTEGNDSDYEENIESETDKENISEGSNNNNSGQDNIEVPLSDEQSKTDDINDETINVIKENQNSNTQPPDNSSCDSVEQAPVEVKHLQTEEKQLVHPTNVLDANAMETIQKSGEKSVKKSFSQEKIFDKIYQELYSK